METRQPALRLLQERIVYRASLSRGANRASSTLEGQKKRSSVVNAFPHFGSGNWEKAYYRFSVRSQEYLHIPYVQQKGP